MGNGDTNRLYSVSEDTHERGVELLIGCNPDGDRVITARLQSGHFNITIITVHSPKL